MSTNPTTFLKSRIGAMITDRGVEVTISPFVDTPGNVDEFEEVIDHSDAYPDSYALPAIVELLPSKVVREKFGLEDEDAILVTLAREHCVSEQINPKVGDRLTTELTTGNWYVRKVDQDLQRKGEYIEVEMLCVRDAGKDDD